MPTLNNDMKYTLKTMVCHSHRQSLPRQAHASSGIAGERDTQLPIREELFKSRSERACTVMNNVQGYSRKHVIVIHYI